MTLTPELESVARAIAHGLGDDLDHAFENKGEWNAAMGEKGGRYRDVNEPFRDDYFEAARAALRAIREPSEAMALAVEQRCDEPYLPESIFTAMIDHVLGGEA